MITTWEEINSRYDAIKDHKPRASKKLKELGEILASAYKLNPQRADEMWQYIIELNVKDNIKFSKFYIAQVYNKLTNNLPSGEAAEFVTMRPERVRLMLIYGYDGGTLNDVAYTIIGSQVQDGRINEAVETVSMLEEKYTTQKDLNIDSLYSVLNTLCIWLENKQEQIEYSFRYDIPVENTLSFYEVCCNAFEDEFIQAILQTRRCLLSGEPILDVDKIRRILHFLSEAAAHTNFELSWLLADFLYSERNIIGNEAEKIVFDYCREAEKVRLPIVSYSKDIKLLEKTYWYQGIVSHSLRILCELFGKEPCQYFLKDVLRNYMYESDWKVFLQLLVLGFSQDTEYGAVSYLNFVKEEIRDYLSMKDKKIEFEDGTWWIVNELNSTPSLTESKFSSESISIPISFSSRSSIIRPRVTENNVNDFIQALARACILTSSSSVNVELVDEVRSFITKETGSVDALTTMGIEVKTDNRTELEKFCDYAEKESVQRVPYDNSYNQRKQEYEFIRNIQQETGTYGIETGKLLARQPQILSFLFLHDAHSFSTKKDIILGALMDDNYTSALKCVDFMIETATYPNYSDRNSWSMEMKNTLSVILRDVSQKNSSEFGEPYPENVTSTVIQIAEKCLTYLGSDDANEVKATLLNLKPEDDEKDAFIRQLLQDVDNYTAEKKPKGYSKRINHITTQIMLGIEALSKLHRMDVAAQIFRKITEGRKFITGPSFESWMTIFSRVTDEQRLELYELIPDVYATYIEASDTKMALSLLQYFGKPGDSTVYRTIRNQILQKHGYIEGMSSCFRYSEETIAPIALCNNKVFEASFLYWNVKAFNIQSGIYGAELVLRVKNRNKEYISLFATDISINGIPLTVLKNQVGKDFSDRKYISYYLDGGEVSTKQLNLNWGNQRETSFKEISEITFSIIAQVDNKDTAKTGPFTIGHDPKAESFKLKA